MRPVHPGEVLREDFLKPLAMSPHALVKALRVPTPRINEIVRNRRGVSADTAMRLARYFGGDARSCLDLQTAYDCPPLGGGLQQCSREFGHRDVRRPGSCNRRFPAT